MAALVVSIPEVKRSQAGHTLYLVTVASSASHGANAASAEQTRVYRRYSSILRLHRHLQSLIEQASGDDDQLPDLPKAKYFGRFNKDVVEKRRLASQLFLAFVVQRPLLYQTNAAKDFFNDDINDLPSSGATPVSSMDDPGVSDSFQPTLVSPAPAQSNRISLSRAGSCNSVDSLPDPPDINDNEFLRQLTPEFCFDEVAADRLEDSTSCDQIDGGEDPLSPKRLSQAVCSDALSAGSDSIWLSRAVSPTPDSADIEVGERSTSNPFFESRSTSGGDACTADLQATMLDVSVLCDETVHAAEAEEEGGEAADSCEESDNEDSADIKSRSSTLVQHDCNHTVTNNSLSAITAENDRQHDQDGSSQPASSAGRPTDLNLDLKNRTQPTADLSHAGKSSDEQSSDVDYIVTASRLVSRAIAAESQSQYDEAYDLYVNGVGVLLSGVQTDSNSFRRDAVRMKTAQYLQRAEVLQRAQGGSAGNQEGNHLREEVSQLPYLTTSGLSGKQSSAVRVLSALESPPASLSYLTNIHQHSATLKNIERPVHVGPRLQDYRVLRPVGKCMLVENKFTGDVYLIKSLVKSQCISSSSSSSSSSNSARRSQCRMKYLCPYMVKPIGHFETASSVFLLLEYIQRGCLWDHLGRFHSAAATPGSANPGAVDTADTTPLLGVAEKQVRRWSAQLVVALSSLHASGFVWRDLHSKNVLLSEEGTILLTYCGDWEHIERPTSSWAIKNMFVAPELSWTEAPSPGADWWSLGALIYELLTGRSFLSMHPGGVTQHERLRLPAGLSERSQSLLMGFLQVNPRERLGAGPTGVEEIKSHPFFAKIRGWHS